MESWLPGIGADRQKASYCSVRAVISAGEKSVVGEGEHLSRAGPLGSYLPPQQAAAGCGSWQNTGNLRQVLATPAQLSVN